MSETKDDQTAEAIQEVADALANGLTSSTLTNWDESQASVVDALANVAHAGNRVADSITPIAAPSHDATGGTVGSLTEAVMGMTAGLVAIAEALNNVADAIREREG